MLSHRNCKWLLTPTLGLALILSAGCGGNGKKEEGKGGDPKAETNQPGKGGEIKVVGYTTVKGRVTFNGDGAPEIKMLTPEKDKEACPPEVPEAGWYTKDSTDGKGVQYALVYLRAKGFKMPEAAKELADPPSPAAEIKQPKCQFEPRVLVLHPKQDLKVLNDSDPKITHDANVTSLRNKHQKSLSPETDVTYKMVADNNNVNKLTCGIHTGTMSAFVWKMNHPYAVVTDADGRFELKHVPVTEGGKLTLAVWHEMLPGQGNKKDIQELDLEADKEATVDFAIPK